MVEFIESGRMRSSVTLEFFESGRMRSSVTLEFIESGRTQSCLRNTDSFLFKRSYHTCL